MPLLELVDFEVQNWLHVVWEGYDQTMLLRGTECSAKFQMGAETVAQKKFERLLEDVFLRNEDRYERYTQLKPRELVIVAAAVLDAALAQMLKRRLLGSTKECDTFLGLNGAGMSPCSSLGAKIQLALLTGILTDFEVKFARTIQKLRNKFAHKVNISFSDPEIMSLVIDLTNQYLKMFDSNKSTLPKDSREYQMKVELFEALKHLPAVMQKDDRFCTIPIMLVMGDMHGVWASILNRIERIEGVEGRIKNVL